MKNQLNKTKKIIIKKAKENGPQGRGPFSQLALAAIIFLLISAYSLFSGLGQKSVSVSLSELSRDVKMGLVTEIRVSGDNLTVLYKDGAEKVSQKEANTALTTTLKNYEVPVSAISTVSITVENDQGFLYWFSSLAPIILPILFIIFFLWFLSRQVKGAGMQAL